jgi:hypothetical protein
MLLENPYRHQVHRRGSCSPRSAKLFKCLTGQCQPLGISSSGVLYLTNIPRIVLPPSTLQNSLVRLPIKRIFPAFHAPSIAMRTECKSAIARPTDPQPIRIAKRLVEGDRAGVCGILVP